MCDKHLILVFSIWMYEAPVACRGELIFYCNALYWWVLSLELGSCHPSGTDIFEVAPKF